MPSPEKTSPSPALSFFTSSLNDLSAISACHQRENAKRAARSVADFERRRYHDRSRRGKLIEIFEALEAVAASTVQQGVRRILRLEQMRLTGHGTDRLDPEAQDIALDPTFDGIGRRTLTLRRSLTQLLNTLNSGHAPIGVAP